MKRRVLISAVLVAVVAVVAAVAVRQRMSQPAPEAGTAQAQARGAGTAATAPSRGAATNAGPAPAEAALEFAATDIVAVGAGRIARVVPLTGTLRPVNQTVVKSKVAGEVRELLVREGMSVRAGQPIALIEPVEFEWRVREREATLRAAEAQLEQARRTFENNRALLEKNFISQSAFDNARFSLDAAAGNRDAAAAQLTVARKQLGDTRVLAPMAGIVAERFAQVGEKVSPDNKLVSIVDLSTMEIEAPVPAAEVAGVVVGQQVALTIEGIEQPQAGRIVRIAPGTQPGTRSVPVYIRLENNDPRIRAGMFAQGTISTGARDNALLVPASAIRDAAGRTFVYAVDGDRLVERSVQVGARDEGARAVNGSTGVVEILSGLAAGERIVAANLGTLRTGSAVRIAPAAQASR